MKLFDTALENCLPSDGIAKYYGVVLNRERANDYLQCLIDVVDWKHDEVVVFGKKHITKRMMAWYGDSNFSYTYSGTTRQASPWIRQLLELKELVEKLTLTTYNSCLLNLYHHGEEGMGWHSDDEDTLEPRATIASLSLGAERKFSFKHKRTGETVSVMLENGSLLAMMGEIQENWLHSLPKTKKVKEPRINLTFRRFSI
ncbi:alpha-ketoglutarate-dependent dioxygenase AlkB [Fulvivirga sp. 29W222]|uniref:Alpha-ketoglutarate-dependent dioxygenase AlkB n=1 Tax=Fulvivirga marina TaxID=2494733 RepID=A0A937FT84_9BACT|nr:alpha-ketoglutarate-dependent dioxygenase AlkB [Fulvivirga marina]MBL6445154.1 alpha-ketoglutarate-dependent dioxygenase AlkB [Fulvivirga marina]